MIKPTVGRQVWFYPGPDDTEITERGKFDDQPMAATIVAVWGDRIVNLAILDHGGLAHQRRSVTLIQQGDAAIPVGYQRFCAWMPYQQAVASGTQAPTLHAPS